MGRMARVTVTFCVSLSPEMAAEIDRIMEIEHRTRSELIREALRRYFRPDSGGTVLDQRTINTKSERT